MQEDTALPSPGDASLVGNEQVIDEGEYAALLEQVLAVRNHVKGLSRPVDEVLHIAGRSRPLF